MSPLGCPVRMLYPHLCCRAREGGRCDREVTHIWNTHGRSMHEYENEMYDRCYLHEIF